MITLEIDSFQKHAIIKDCNSITGANFFTDFKIVQIGEFNRVEFYTNGVYSGYLVPDCIKVI